jgi:hypothetical protein
MKCANTAVKNKPFMTPKTVLYRGSVRPAVRIATEVPAAQPIAAGTGPVTDAKGIATPHPSS